MSTPFPLGRKQFHDPRSRAYVAPAAGSLRSVIHTPPPLAKRLDQGQTSSCEGNGSAHVLGTKPLHIPRSRYLTEADALKIYEIATHNDPWPEWYPDTDEGTSNTGAGTACVKLGYIEKFTHCFGTEHVLHSLVEAPLLAGVPWSNDMFATDAEGFVEPTGGWAGGHAFGLFGLNVRDEYVWALNSWRSWGLRGLQLFKISFSNLDILVREGGEFTRFHVTPSQPKLPDM